MSLANEATTVQEPATKPKQVAGHRASALRLHLENIYRLTIKELRSIRSDPIMLVLVAYAFTIAIYAAATGASTEATNRSVAIVDEDRSDLSRRIADGLTPPTFRSVTQISASEIDAGMDSQRFLYVIEIPPRFQEDILAGRKPTVQINIDATASAQAFNGMTYIQNVILNYATQFVTGREGLLGVPIKIVTRAMFNPNFKSSWFTSVIQIISNLTMITVILTGAALIREREQGTVEHLLVMPVVPVEIMVAKILANGMVILAAAGLSLTLVVQWWLEVPVAGSTLLFLGGACFYVFTVAALGIALGTVASTMGQFGLLSIPVLLVIDAAFRQHDAIGEHAGLAAVRDEGDQSQKHAGWHSVRDMYDDGGLSGGTMERPALQRLLADIKAGKVQIVVVYKVDRLTRSLADFAKIVDIMDAHGASFVSVTQQFNTTTSMGRLTLNMLLSFAQFEREIAGERIRDKIAASKAKGMWMGGNVPLGYDVSKIAS